MARLAQRTPLPGRRDWRRPRGLGGTLVWLAGAAVASVTALAQTSSIPSDPDKLLIVDCLLPPQVRQLGGQRTYLTARRPARLTANECEIRGGEYVAYDRANYETALRFWLPQAEEGDADAQAYVAEIYEKGLGTTPDYAVAAEWYRKAAEQGHESAQLSLAYLYEQGLGVEQDEVRALNLYREATGIEDDDLTYASEVTAARTEAQRIIDSLAAQLEDQNEALESLRADLAYTRDRLEDRRTELEAARIEVGDLQAQLEEAERSNASPARQAELERLEQRLRDSQQQLAWRQREVAELEADSAERRAQLTQRLREAADREAMLEERLAAKDAESEALRNELDEAQQALYENESRVAELTAALAEQRARLARQREAVIREGTAASDEQREQLQALEAHIATQQEQIAALEAEQREHVATIAELRDRERERASRLQAREAELESVSAELVGARKRLLETEQRVSDLTTQLREEQERIALQREQLERREQRVGESRRAEIEELNRRLLAREATVAEQRALIDTLKEQARRYTEEIARFESRQGAQLAMRSVGSGTSAQFEPTRSLVRDFDLGEYHALIIGNDTYEHLPGLDTAVNDARKLDELLREKYGFRTRLLINATRVEILSALNEYRQELETADSLLIYYAGHGELDQRNLRGYWLPTNADRSSTTERISDQMVTDQISLMAARHVLVVADSCYSGVMTRNSGLRLVASGGRAGQLKRLEKLARLPSRTVLTSGGEQPVLDGGGGEHSIFARRLIEVLSDNEGVLEGSALYDRLFDDVREKAADFGIEQSPRYSVLADAGHLNGEFLFVPST